VSYTVCQNNTNNKLNRAEVFFFFASVISIFATTNEKPFYGASFFELVVSMFTIFFILTRTNPKIPRPAVVFSKAFFFFLSTLVFSLVVNLIDIYSFSHPAEGHPWAVGLKTIDIRAFLVVLKFLPIFFFTIFLLAFSPSRDLFHAFRQAIIISSYIMSIIILAQLVFSILGIDLFYLSHGYSIIVPRIGGLTGEAQTFGALLVLLLFSIILIKEKNKIPHSSALIFILLIGIVASQSIVVHLAFLTSLAYYFIFLSRPIHKVLLILLLFILFLVIFNLYFERIVAEALNVSSRSSTWIAGVSLFIDNPLFGVGPGLSPYHVPIVFDNNPSFYSYALPDQNYTPIMSLPIRVLSEIGLLGGIAFIVLLYKSRKLAINHGASDDHRRSHVINSMLIFVFICSLSSVGYFYSPILYFPFWLFIILKGRE